MPIGRVWIYGLLFVCVLCVCVCVCTVTDFSAKDKASGIKFCTAVRRRPRQGITHFGELCSPRSPKSDESAWAALSDSSDRDATFVEYRAACGRRIGMCGYRSVPTDVLVLISNTTSVISVKNKNLKKTDNSLTTVNIKMIRIFILDPNKSDSKCFENKNKMRKKR